MNNLKPKFDPSQPFEAAPVSKPKFDPSQPYQPVDVSSNQPQEEGLGSKAAKFAGGVGLGVLEGINPLSIPHGIETLSRAIFTESGGPMERLQKGSENAVIPPLRFEDVGRDIRTSGRVLAGAAGSILHGELPNLSALQSIQAQEKAKQDAVYNAPYVQGGRQAGELGTAIVQLGQLGVTGLNALNSLAPKVAEKFAQLKGLNILTNGSAMEKINELAGSLSNAATRDGMQTMQKLGAVNAEGKPLAQAQKLTKELLGDVTPEVADAIFNRSQAVKQALQGGRPAQELFSDVKALRDHINTTQDYMGELVGGFKNLLRQNSTTELNTSGAVQKISRTLNDLKLDTGQSILSQGDAEILAKYKSLFMNPTELKKIVKGDILSSGSFEEMMSVMTPQQKNAFINGLLKEVPDKSINIKKRSVGDVSRIIDLMDDDLNAFYNGRLKNASGQAMAKVAEIRNELKGELHRAYPGYQDADELYKAYKTQSEGLQNKIESMGGESFLANIFGENKTEVRQEFQNLVGLGEQFSKRVKNLSIEAVPDANAFKQMGQIDGEASDAIQLLKEKASSIQFRPAQEFLDNIANKIAARALQKTKEGGLADFPADKIQRLINSYVDLRGNAARVAAEKWGTVGGAIMGGMGGGLAGSVGGLFASGGGMLGGGLMGAKYGKDIVGNFAERIARVRAVNEAKDLYNPMKIFEFIEKSSASAPATKQLAKDVQDLSKVFGQESAIQFLKAIPLRPEFKQDIFRAISELSQSAKTIGGKDREKGK